MLPIPSILWPHTACCPTGTGPARPEERRAAAREPWQRRFRLTRQPAQRVGDLLLIRVAERETGETWRTLNWELDKLHLGRLVGPTGEVRQRTETSPRQAAILKALGIAERPRFFGLEPTVATARRPRRAATIARRPASSWVCARRLLRGPRGLRAATGHHGAT